jgi:hypothetical protein
MYVYEDVDFDDILFTDNRTKCLECFMHGLHKLSCSKRLGQIMKNELNCNFCGETKAIELFTKNNVSKTGYSLCCKECKNAKQRLNRNQKGDIYTKKYEKTKKGYLMRTYRNMLFRVTGVLKKKAHLYEGLEILDKDEFYAWSLADKNFNKLFEIYEETNYTHALSPSIDRVDSNFGYTLDNMRWLTHSENSILGSQSHKRKIKFKEKEND